MIDKAEGKTTAAFSTSKTTAAFSTIRVMRALLSDFARRFSEGFDTYQDEPKDRPALSSVDVNPPMPPEPPPMESN